MREAFPKFVYLSTVDLRSILIYTVIIINESEVLYANIASVYLHTWLSFGVKGRF